MADDTVKQRKFIIQDAYDFYTWAKQTQIVNSCDFVSVEKVQAYADFLRDISVTTIDGTMKLHAVVGNGKGITVRCQSCYCELCFENGEFHFSYSGWNFHQLNFPSHHGEIEIDDDNEFMPVQCTTI